MPGRTIKTTKTSRTNKVEKDTISSDIDDYNSPDFVTFWRPTDRNAIYGQWYLSNFCLDQSILDSLPKQITELSIFEERPDVIEQLMNFEFNCAEQFMMLGKALLFKDYTVAKLIKNEKNPKKHRTLGRQVRNYDGDLWDAFCLDVVILTNYLKFSQDDNLNKLILETGDAILVEGSPMDKIWGVGLRFDDPKILNEDNWKGQNKLGHCLMKVRDIL